MSERKTTYTTETPVPAEVQPCGETVELNLFVRTPDGYDAHVKLSGTSATKSVKRLGELSKVLAEAGFTPSQRPAAGRPQPQTTAAATGPACPEHGPDRIKPSKFGNGVYCAARNDDGSYCRWQERNLKAVAS